MPASAPPVRILAVSDKTVNNLCGPQAQKIIGPVDLLLACGDLSYSYLECLVTMLHTPHAFFVHGNHDAPEKLKNGRLLSAPGGWQNVDQQVVSVPHNNLLIAGLEGSICYRPGALYQYTQQQMRWRAYRLILPLLWNRVRYGRYVDIFIAHSPAAGIHAGTDGAHQGFEIFLTLLRHFRPRLFLHGHQHRYGLAAWQTQYAQTEIVNIYPFRIIELYPDKIVYDRCYHC
ncbi:MAG: metallophosphoesterase [Anaerolineae bacterium]|nr:metallophosphoesterase [Anaerolineae bacterium]